MAFARRAAMSDDDLGLPDPDAWKTELPEISRTDPRLLRTLATLNWETGEIIPATDLIKWAIWFERTDNHVALEEVSGFIVSTVFLGINHSFGSRRPQWFETMVFRQMDNKRMLGRLIDQWRYSTIEEARAGHAKVVEAVQKGEIGE
jgi:hypothetical protein